MAFCAMALAMAATLGAKDKGDKFFKQAQVAEQKGDWDKALDLYEQALDIAPNNPPYMIAMRRARFQAGQKHVNDGQKLRSDGKLEEALGEFQRALVADPSSSIAIQEMKTTQKMIERAKANPGESLEDLALTPVEEARREDNERVDSIMAPPELKPVVNQVGPLKMNNQPPKVLYETVGKLAGVNVLFDAQYNPPARNFNVEFPNSTAEQAFDYLALLTHTVWKAISPNAIFVYEDNPTKHRDYDDEVVKTFYLTNVTSAQEFNEIVTLIRTVIDARRVFSYAAQRAMVVRGTVDAVGLAEKLIRDLDKPKAEVIVDVIVMQVNSDRSKNLAATIATAGTAGLSMPIAFTPGGIQPVSTTPYSPTGVPNCGLTPNNGNTGLNNGVTPGLTGTPGAAVGQATLGQLGHLGINDFSTSLPGGLLNMMMSDTQTKVINSSQIRASDGQKATLNIGSKIPVATGSFQPGVGTVGVSPLVSTQFNFVDTGVNLTIQPQVHSAEEVTLHIEVDVSSVQSYSNLGGIEQPIIGQNKNTADIRLREGEVNILSGLSSTSDSNSLTGLPGLTNIPVLGKFLFGNTVTDKQKGELLIALIPHIIRTPGYTAENLRAVAAGNDTVIKLNYAPRPEEAAPPAGAAPPVVSTIPQPAPAPGQSQIGFLPAAIQAPLSSPVIVTIQVRNAADLFSASPLKVKFDPAQLRLNDIAPGELLSRDGIRVTSVKDIRNDTGEATLTVTRALGSAGVSGAGAIATLSFVAVGRGSSRVTVVDSVLKNSKQQTVPATLGELPVTIQ